MKGFHNRGDVVFVSTAVCVRERSAAPRVPEDRVLHLVDVENLCGGSRVSGDAVATAMHDYGVAVRVGSIDHVIVACSPQLAIPSHDAAPDARIPIGRGFDGADLALIGAADAPDIVRRFDGVIIGSGDHIFASMAASLRLMGVPVTVVSRESSLSASLARAAQTVVRIPDLPEPIGEAALRKVA